MILRVLLFQFVLTSYLQVQPLDEVIVLAGQGVQKFSADFSGVKCTENLTQLKLDEKGRTILRRVSTFDYIATVKVAEGSPRLEESRLIQEVHLKSSGPTQFTTTGFAGLNLIFHPQVRDNYIFSDVVDDQLNGRTVRRVRFEHKTGTPSITAFQDRDRIFPIDWAGNAWIDPANGAVLRIHARLMAPIDNLGLRSLEALVDYAAVTFPDAEASYWLPKNATIDLKTERQHWRNMHTFRDYRRFSAIVTGVTP